MTLAELGTKYPRGEYPILWSLIDQLPPWAHEHPRLEDALKEASGQPLTTTLVARVTTRLRSFDVEADG